MSQSSNPIRTIDNRTKEVAAADARVTAADAAVKAAEQALQEARNELRVARLNRPTMFGEGNPRRNLAEMARLRDEGGTVVYFKTNLWGKTTLNEGILLRETVARYKVLTEWGEVTFSKKGSKWGQPGEGMGEHRGLVYAGTASDLGLN